MVMVILAHVRLAAARAGLGLAMLPEPLVRNTPALQLVLSSAVAGSLDLMIFVNAELRREPRIIAARNVLTESPVALGMPPSGSGAPDSLPGNRTRAELISPSARTALAQLPGVATLPRECIPYEHEPCEHKQGLNRRVLSGVGDVMEAKDPMHPHDVETQDEARAREDTQEERVRCGSLTPQQTSNQNGEGDCKDGDSSRRGADYKHVYSSGPVAEIPHVRRVPRARSLIHVAVPHSGTPSRRDAKTARRYRELSFVAWHTATRP